MTEASSSRAHAVCVAVVAAAGGLYFGAANQAVHGVLGRAGCGGRPLPADVDAAEWRPRLVRLRRALAAVRWLGCGPCVLVAGLTGTGPDAELRTYPGMGHDPSEQLWPDLFDRICRFAGRQR